MWKKKNDVRVKRNNERPANKMITVTYYQKVQLKLYTTPYSYFIRHLNRILNRQCSANCSGKPSLTACDDHIFLVDDDQTI